MATTRSAGNVLPSWKSGRSPNYSSGAWSSSESRCTHRQIHRLRDRCPGEALPNAMGLSRPVSFPGSHWSAKILHIIIFILIFIKFNYSPVWSRCCCRLVCVGGATGCCAVVMLSLRVRERRSREHPALTGPGHCSSGREASLVPSESQGICWALVVPSCSRGGHLVRRATAIHQHRERAEELHSLPS